MRTLTIKFKDGKEIEISSFYEYYEHEGFLKVLITNPDVGHSSITEVFSMDNIDRIREETREDDY